MTDLNLALHQLDELESEFASTLAIDQTAADQIFREARTANSFTDEPVTDTQLGALYDLVKWGPTAMNSQPLRIVFARTHQARARVASYTFDRNQAKTAAAPVVAVLAAALDFHDEFDRTFPANPHARAAFADDEAKREVVAVQSALLQTGYFILGARAVGLAAGPVGGFDAAALSADLFPDGRHRVLLVVNLGHPGEDSYRARQPRLDFADVAAII